MGQTGKIARLPAPIREELNQRLFDGETGRRLIAWLNGLPAVQAIVAAEFHGQPMAECNLSRWKRTGYKSWKQAREMREAGAAMIQEVPEMPELTRKTLLNRVAALLTGDLVMQVRRLDAMREGKKKSRRQRDLMERFLTLRRGDLEAERLRVEQKKLAFQELRHQGQEKPGNSTSGRASGL